MGLFGKHRARKRSHSIRKKAVKSVEKTLQGITKQVKVSRNCYFVKVSTEDFRNNGRVFNAPKKYGKGSLVTFNEYSTGPFSLGGSAMAGVEKQTLGSAGKNTGETGV